MTDANSPEKWDAIWRDPAQAEWRGRALAEVYDRICELVPAGSRVVDLGGGVGTLAFRLYRAGSKTLVVDNSPRALDEVEHAAAVFGAKIWRGVETMRADLEDAAWLVKLRGRLDGPPVFVATEALEHLSGGARAVVLDNARVAGAAIFSVPNNRLGPDEEPQHTIKWTALEFLQELRRYFKHCRVEVLGGYLLGVCGKLAEKPYRLSVCTPARDEAADIERTLASFRGVADQLVVGIDPRSTDDTEAIARRYAEVVFTLDEPDGPADDKAPAVHMAHIRNQCLDRCDGDWVFMTEAHESLAEGQDVLLHLDQVDEGAKVAFVMRTGSGQRWAFPWLHRNDSRIRYTRATHNELLFPDSYLCVRLPQISTLHQRSRDTIERRRAQRKVQNRRTLTEDWVLRGNDNSLLYLGSEWAEYDKDKAVQRLQEFLAVNRNNGAKRYHARLQCAKMLAQQGDAAESRVVLIGAAADDWSRVDHWFYLGDLALEAERHEEALQFYRYVSTRIEDPPFCVWWVDLSIYGYLCAQRLTQCYATLGKLEDALHWAERAVELLPEDSPAEATDEARHNVELIQEALSNAS
jgi:SAM-dependent methyltransferase